MSKIKCYVHRAHDTPECIFLKSCKMKDPTEMTSRISITNHVCKSYSLKEGGIAPRKI